MKFTLSWLKDHLETEATLDDILYALTDLGLEVEEVANPADSLGAFRICRVIEAVQHPNADRLRLCRVETWPDGPGSASQEVQVVCGAPNARTGLVGVFAPVGTHVPGTGVDLKPGVIRGVESNGMLCSERELMISDDHDGIIDLPEDAPLGARFIDYRGLNDPMIYIKITPNRPDALGVRGIARDLAARGLGTLKPLQIAPVKGGFASPVGVTIDPALKENGCPLFAGRVIRGVKNGPSPDWLQARLRAIGLRPISALVDITNFFTYDLNRPLHVFDMAKVKGGTLRIHPAQGGEEILALDGKTYALQPGMMVISDAEQAESIAGIMGGEHSGCTEETTDVFLESAYWDPITIATTGRALKINSDARYRFERGVDPEFTLPGLELATQMVLDLCGGEASEVVMDGAVPDTKRAYRLDTDRVQSLVGMEIAPETQRATLAALGFTLDGDMAVPPSWRPDVLGSADLVEEVARIASLTRLEGKPMARTQAGVPAPILTPLQVRETAARRTLAALGYNECVTYSFIDQGAAALFGGGQEGLRVENPISSEMTHMRPDLLPGLLQAAARNQARGFMDLALCEVGPAFTGGEPGEQVLHATGLLVGAAAPRDPYGSRRPVDLYDAKADAEAVLAALGAPARVQINRKVAGWWHPGRSGNMALGPNALASFGELHPRVLAELGVKGPAVAFTVMIENVPQPKAKGTTRPALELSALQVVERDFAFVVDAGVEALTLVNAAQGADKALIERVSVFDSFSGGKAEAQMGAGKKSIAISVRLQPKDKTLTEEEIEAVSARIVEKVGKATGGVLRG
ncbi:phenylalanyl-tRNA synthetase subunit beta [Defluviimonas sp. 20V17]|uniref:Phenylalanine--tRNA ligase beta subunit n=1 Tax=Allgaiera indica TaxID=765699 RepID=A0AAN5A079_9RHOB|nr:phenylalanine--tRNA ligase subunit beta [Allgaiera indica]KDB05565.1 phenylalanyl-tRNA synthetase subunit beta [Defluviimonas sp. 20V17]GHE03621.1 phenylalanine--tRNA ligase beta subunit [Allgaiera indica]SDX45084.1 phenylalanyl-tRNA synthetase beta subunit [Allgaiera indica]